jgi:hypothetical protein
MKHFTINESLCKNIIGKCFMTKLGTLQNALIKEDWSSEKWHDVVIKNETLLDFTQKFVSDRYTEHSEVQLIWGAQFAANKKNILCHNKEYFEAAIDTLNNQHPIEGHYMERIWDLFFACDLEGQF